MSVTGGWRSTWQRRTWLVAVLGLHALVLLGWRPMQRVVPDRPQRESALVYVLAPPPRPVPRPKALPPAAVAPAHVVARSQPLAAAPVVTAPPVDVAPVTPAVDPLALPAPTPAPAPQSLLERSRSAAIGIDRQLRRESKNDNDRVLTREPELARQIALAYKGSGAFSMVETVLPNGDVLVKVTNPLTTYCILKRGNNAGAGLNQIDQAGKVLIVNCPK
jgi:hypothetical protein